MSHFRRDPSCPDTCPSAVCTKPCCAQRRPAGSNAPRCHLDGEEGARRREGITSRRRRVHLHAHLRAQRASYPLCPSPQPRFISNMLMTHAAQRIILDATLKKKRNSLTDRGIQQKRVSSSPEQKSPPGYRRAGEASPWLHGRMQTHRWRRSLKDDGANCTFSCHLPLRVGNPPSF